MGDDGGTTPRRSRRRRWTIFAIVLPALVVGLAGGYLLRTVTEPAAAPLAPPSASPAPPAAPTPPPASTPCLAVAERGDDLLVQLERAVRAIAALDPGTLRAVVDDVERLHAEMQRAADACRADQAGG